MVIFTFRSSPDFLLNNIDSPCYFGLRKDGGFFEKFRNSFFYDGMVCSSFQPTCNQYQPDRCWFLDRSRHPYNGSVKLTLLTQKHTCMINTKTTKMANWAWNKIFPFTSGLTWKSVVRFWHGLCFSQICVREQNAHSNRKFSSLEHFVYEFFSSRNEPRRSNTNFSRLIYVRSDYMQLASKAIFPLIEKW